MKLFKNTKENKSLKDKIEDILNTEKLIFFNKIENDHQFILELKMRLDNGLTDCYIDIRKKINLVKIISFSSICLPENKKNEISYYLHLVNKELSFGHFELNYNNGDIHVVTYFICEDMEKDLSEIFKRNLYTNFNIMEIYMPGVMDIVYKDKNAKTALNKINNNIDYKLN